MKEVLVDWCSKLDKNDKKFMGIHGFGFFLNVKQLKVEYEFLDACLELWDSKIHVFRFDGGEFVPLLEELKSLLTSLIS